MTHYIKYRLKDPIHDNEFVADRFWKFQAELTDSRDTESGFVELTLQGSEGESLEFISIGDKTYGFRSKCSFDAESIKRLIAIIENEYSTVIYRQDCAQYFGYDNWHEYGHNAQIALYLKGQFPKKDQHLLKEILSHFEEEIHLDHLNMDEEIGAKVYFGLQVLKKYPHLIIAERNRELLIRTNALYRDELLKSSLINSSGVINEVLEDVKRLGPVDYNPWKRMPF